VTFFLAFLFGANLAMAAINVRLRQYAVAFFGLVGAAACGLTLVLA
jgi:hypothetical protein